MVLEFFMMIKYVNKYIFLVEIKLEIFNKCIPSRVFVLHINLAGKLQRNRVQETEHAWICDLEILYCLHLSTL